MIDFKNKKLIPLAIFGGLLLIAIFIRLNPPESEQRTPFPGPMMTVETRVVAETDYPIMLESYGTVQPRTRSILVAQVGGQIVSVNENVRDGGFFERGDALAQILRRHAHREGEHAHPHAPRPAVAVGRRRRDP